MFRVALLMIASTLALQACSISRSIQANKIAQTMVGMTRNQVLQCAGIPNSRTAIQNMEVFRYGGTRIWGGTVVGNSVLIGRQGCYVNVNFVNEKVSKVVLRGADGGIANENSCYYIVRQCGN